MHFDTDTRTERTSPGVYSAAISDRWSINNNPNGGYLMAVMSRALLTQSDFSSTPIVTANYLARCVPGPATIEVREISRTRQFHRFEASIIQDGAERVRALATFASGGGDCSINRYEASPPELAPREDCVLIPTIPTYTLFGELDVMLDPSCAGWMQNKLVERSENKGWLRFKNERPYDLPAVLLIADSMPPAVMASQGMMTWVPTIEISVNVRAMPQSTWLRCSLRTRFITCGLLEADGEVWDEAGNLVAISRQIAQAKKL